MAFEWFFLDWIMNVIYNWSFDHGHIDIFYVTCFTEGIRGLDEATDLGDIWVIDIITNCVDVATFFAGEGKWKIEKKNKK